MGWLSKLFGYCGTIRFKVVTEDGREFEGTIDIECFNVGNKELEEKIKNICHVKYGWRAAELKIIAST